MKVSTKFKQENLVFQKPSTGLSDDNKLSNESFLINKFKEFDSNLAIAELDLSFKVISADENYHFLLGYEKDELLNESHTKLLSHDFRNSEKLEKFEKEIYDGEFLKGKFTRLNKKGEEIVLEGVYFLVLDEKQQVKKIVNIYFNENSRSSNLPLDSSGNVFENTQHLKTTGSEYRIMIVEDEGDLNCALRDYLKKEGYHEVMFCKTGEEAIQASAAFKPDVVVLNYNLKGSVSAGTVSGQVQKFCDCPVIFISSFNNDIQALNKNLAKSYFLDEPVDRKQLVSLLKHIQLL